MKRSAILNRAPPEPDRSSAIHAAPTSEVPQAGAAQAQEREHPEELFSARRHMRRSFAGRGARRVTASLGRVERAATPTTPVPDKILARLTQHSHILRATEWASGELDAQNLTHSSRVYYIRWWRTAASAGVVGHRQTPQKGDLVAARGISRAPGLATPTGDFIIHTTHIPPGSSNGWIKVAMLEAVSTVVGEPAPTPRVLCGDFNVPQG